MTTWLEHLAQDVRHGLRAFATSPGFAAICVLSIACGTGANVAMFSVADALLLRPLPVPRPNELLVLGTRTDRGYPVTAASHPDYVDIRDQSRSFAGVLAYTLRWSGVSAAAGATPQIKVVQLVSGNFFDVIQMPPAIGRGFLAEEDRVPGRDAVAVLSYGIWQTLYAGDPGIVGRTIRVSGTDFTIVGVMPQGFTGLETRGVAESVYVPLAMAPAMADERIQHLLTARDLRLLTVRGRLTRTATMADARAELAAIGSNLARAYPETNEKQAFIAQTELEARIADHLDAGLVLLLTILSTAVLGVACANVAGLLSSRAPLRAREIALRLAIGASRARLVRQLVTESVMLALAGGAAGLAFGYAGILVLRQIHYPSDTIQPPAFHLDERALLFSLAVAMASAFLFGVGPALQTTRVDLVSAMKPGDAKVPRRWRLSGRSHLVAIQVALCLVIVTVAAFTFQVFRRVTADGPGFRTTQMAKVGVDTAYGRYDDRQATAFFEQALDAARRLPGVTAATAISTMPLWGFEGAVIVPEGYAMPDRTTPLLPALASVDEDYFATMGIPVLRGRGFRATDGADAPRVAIVNETCARRYWPGGDAVGRRFRLGGDEGPWIAVVGVARDSKYSTSSSRRRMPCTSRSVRSRASGWSCSRGPAVTRCPRSARCARWCTRSIRISRCSKRRRSKSSMRRARQVF